MDWYCSATHVLFIPGGYTAELQQADIASSRALKHSIKPQAMQFFAESVCQNDAVLDLRLSTMKRLMAHWVPHACAEVQKSTSITTKAWRHLSWTLEEAPGLAARATREHHNGTLFDETEVEQEEPPEEEADLILMTTAVTVAGGPGEHGDSSETLEQNLEGNTGLQQFSSKPPRGILVGCASRLERRPYASTQT